MTHTHTHTHTWYDDSGRMISPAQSVLLDYTDGAQRWIVKLFKALILKQY